MNSKILVALALAGALLSGAAAARGHVDFGLYFGPGYWPYAPYYYAPYPYYPPYYYYPPAVPAPAPPTYVERQAPPPPAEPWWYYCPAAKAYYPYVRECAEGWQRVEPAPPPPNQ